MNRKFDKKTLYGLFFSFILFGSIFYVMNDNLLLGASVSSVVNNSGSKEILSPAPAKQTVDSQNQDASKKDDKNTDVVKEEAEPLDNVPENVYIVKSGQTLWEIAQELGVSLTELMNTNQLSNSFIMEGQELLYNK